MKVDLALLSDAGARSENQDAVVALIGSEGRALLAVADGLGGHKGGRQAAELAISILTANWEETPLDEIFLKIHREIKNVQHLDKELYGMATTITAVVVEDNKLNGAHCGDTRCSVQRGSGIRKLTIAHTEAQRLFDAGKLSKEEFINYPRRNVLDRALGGEKTPVIDTFNFQIENGDKIIITSDGVHEKIMQRELLSLVANLNDANEVVQIVKSRILIKKPDDNYSIVCAIVFGS